MADAIRLMGVTEVVTPHRRLARASAVSYLVYRS